MSEIINRMSSEADFYKKTGRVGDSIIGIVKKCQNRGLMGFDGSL